MKSQISINKTPFPININEHAKMALLAAIVGIAGGLGAIVFRYLIDFVQFVSYGSSHNLLYIIDSIPWYMRIIYPALGGYIVGTLVYYFAREAKGHGVPEVMEAVALRAGIIRKRIVLIKSLASAICIGTGGSVGREGPIVQIGSAIGSLLGQIIKISSNRIRTLVGCGAAAGIAATFNAPIAGSMFTIEIILGDFGLATFSPIVISSVTATAISRHFLGDKPAFIVPSYELVSAWELPLYVFLGFFCAIIAVSFTRLLYGSEDLFDSIKFPLYLKTLLGGAILGCTGLVFPHIMGVGYSAIDLALAQKLSLWTMLFLILFKLFATSITIGSGGSGGIFAPSLFIGVMTGGFFGSVVHSIFPNITASPGAYSIVGMGALVSGTTHGPLTSIMILFEMTGDYKIILPLMISCIVSALVSGQLFKESIYTLKLARRGINIKSGKDINVLKSIQVKEVMNLKVETMQESLKLGQLAEKISKSKNNSFPVLNSDGTLTGILSYIDYHDVIFDDNLKDLIVAKDLATLNVVTVSENDDLYTAFEKISSKDFSILPVVSSNNSSNLIGVLSRRDMLSAYNKTVIKKNIFQK